MGDKCLQKPSKIKQIMLFPTLRRLRFDSKLGSVDPTTVEATTIGLTITTTPTDLMAIGTITIHIDLTMDGSLYEKDFV
ncbi:MAG: hypothetical protein S4CHLAM2_15550 [Chlamydiales bacterium]|nr:hypothetical protein [Chlamydiales bacterium]